MNCSCTVQLNVLGDFEIEGSEYYKVSQGRLRSSLVDSSPRCGGELAIGLEVSQDQVPLSHDFVMDDPRGTYVAA